MGNVEKIIETGAKVIRESDVGKQLQAIFDEVVAPLIERLLQMELAELADVYSEDVDKLILRMEAQQGYKYVGGEFKIHYKDENTFTQSIVLYFKDKDNQWKEATAKSKPQDMRKYLKPSAIERLRTEGTISFEVDPPVSVNRA